MPDRNPQDGTASMVSGPFVEKGWSYNLDDVPVDLAEVIRVAVGDVGVREDPPKSNDGPKLKKYKIGLNSFGKYYPWCVFALSYWYSFMDGGCPWGVLASAYKLHEWAVDKDRMLGISPIVRPGDVGIDLRKVEMPDGRKMVGHVGLVVHVLPDGRLCMVEGNAGDAVRARIKKPGEWRYLMRPTGRCE